MLAALGATPMDDTTELPALPTRRLFRFIYVTFRRYC